MKLCNLRPEKKLEIMKSYKKPKYIQGDKDKSQLPQEKKKKTLYEL